MKVFEAIQLPEIVQVGNAIFPQPGNLAVRFDDAAVLSERLSNHGHAAAASADARCHQFVQIARGECRGDVPQIPPGHSSKCSLLCQKQV